MRWILAFICLLLAAPPTADAANAARDAGAGAWRDDAGRPDPARSGVRPGVRPDRFRGLQLDASRLGARLDQAPGERAERTLTLALPAPGGGFRRFAVRRSTVMSPELAARHPGIATYSGRGLDEPDATVHLDLGPLGLHASVRTPRGGWYVDPYYRGDARAHVSYHARALDEQRRDGFAEAEPIVPAGAARMTATAPAAADGAAVRLRQYRLALLTDPSYAGYHGGGDAVVAAKVALVNRLNQIYEQDLAVRLVLVAGDLELDTTADMTGADGPCGAAPCFSSAEAETCSSATLARTRIVLGQLLGADRYDVGHLAMGNDGGGLASLGVAGGAYKAQGCTGVPAPRGDVFAVDYVAHELGHQFSGRHTFNGCDANRTGATSVEPGSGSSIMAYAGICGDDDLQDHSDPYFSQRSLEEIGAYVASAHPAVSEIQTVSLRRFDASADAFRLAYPGGGISGPIVRGSNYTAASIKAAVEGIPGFPAGRTVTVTGFAGSGTPGDTGFRLAFSGATDVPELSLVEPAGAEGFVGTTVQGGPVANGGSTVHTTPNREPVVTAAPDRTIPVRTPFTLTGSATDADGDALSFSWEQNDPGTTATPLRAQPKLDGPLFRQFGTRAFTTDPLSSPAPGANTASARPARDFPDVAQVLAGATNAATGSCPPADVDCFSEFLPTADYAGPLHFRLTARDGHPGGGGVGHDDTMLTTAPAAGPFRITSQATPQAAPAGGTLAVTWDAARTHVAPVNATEVRILLSADGGATFDTVLAPATPNDGLETVRLPATPAPRARIRIEAVGNVFFDVSRADLTIEPAPAPETTTDAPAGDDATASAGPASAVTPAATGPGPDGAPAPAAPGEPAPAASASAATPEPTPALRVRLRRAGPRLAVSRTGRVAVRISCEAASAPPEGERCRGIARLRAVTAGGRRTVARAPFDVAPGATARVVVQLTPGARRRALRRGLRARLLASTGPSHAHAATHAARTVRLRR